MSDVGRRMSAADAKGYRYIIHIDMDAYFASVEQRDLPLYRRKPLIICHTDDPESYRGVVSTASYEARPYGVKSGMSVYEAKKKCRHAIYLTGNYEKYLYNSRKILKICQRYSDLVEVFSVDEFFVDVTRSKHLFGGAVAAAKGIQRAVKEELGLSASVGLAPNKLVAKMASEFQKPGGFTVISPEELPDILAPLAVDKIPGIGEKTKRHLNSIGVETIDDLAKISVAYLKHKFGLVGIALHQAALGIDESPVLSQHQEIEVKSFGQSSALGKGISDLQELNKILLGLCEGAARRLRKEGYLGRTVVLRLCLARMISFTRNKTISEFTAATRMIYAIAKELLLKESKALSKYPATLIGLSVTNLINKKQGHQISIFDLLDWREEALMEAVDRVKDKYGDGIIVRGTLLGWRSRYHKVPQLDI